jgi:hypothetical protein
MKIIKHVINIIFIKNIIPGLTAQFNLKVTNGVLIKVS